MELEPVQRCVCSFTSHVEHHRINSAKWRCIQKHRDVSRSLKLRRFQVQRLHNSLLDDNLWTRQQFVLTDSSFPCFRYVNVFPPAFGAAVPRIRLGWVADKSHVTTEHARWIHKGIFSMNIGGYVSWDTCGGMYCDKICRGRVIYDEVTGENLKRKRLGHGNNLKMNEARNWYIWCRIYKSNAFIFLCKTDALFPLCRLNESHEKGVNLWQSS